MISSIEGLLEKIEPDAAIIKIGALSIRIFMPASTLHNLKSVGQKIKIQTHLHLREDNITLFGFLSVEELKLFQNLLSVSGIGPKAGLALLSGFEPAQLASAIATGNIDLLCKVPGIGKKTAGRIVLELKGKLEKEWDKFAVPMVTKEDTDVIAALTSLGYSVKEATQAVSILSGARDIDLEERVKLALQQLAKI
jgi:Holliday junction DNA helicase RuvA